jgi:hypothetical protein
MYSNGTFLFAKADSNNNKSINNCHSLCCAARMIEITCVIYKEPRVMVEDISALGLRSAAKTDIFCTSQFGYIEI